MLLAEHGTFHHVYDFDYVELPRGIHVPLPNLLGFQLTKFMVLQLAAAVIVLLIFRGLARRIRNGETAHGWWWNFWEMLALYIRDEVVRPIIGDPHSHHNHDHLAEHPEEVETLYGHEHPLEKAEYAEVTGASSHAVTGGHPADAYLPFVWSCFFSLLICNLLGALPWLGSATGSINVTGALALVAFGATYFYGAKEQGWGGFWTGLVPSLDVPPALKVLLVPMMFVIEVVGLFIKHGVLAIRLFANMMGGHTVLGVMLAFIAGAAGGGIVVPRDTCQHSGAGWRRSSGTARGLHSGLRVRISGDHLHRHGAAPALVGHAGAAAINETIQFDCCSLALKH